MPLSGLVKAIAFAAVAAVALSAGHYLSRAHFGGGAAQNFQLADIDGKMHELDGYRGRFVLVNFWAPWCAPCREEVPLLMRARARHREKDLQILGISLDGEENTRIFRDEFGVNYPLLAAADAGSRLLGAWQSGGAIPFSVLIDRAGRIRHRKSGAYEAGELQEVLRAELR